MDAYKKPQKQLPLFLRQDRRNKASSDHLFHPVGIETNSHRASLLTNPGLFDQDRFCAGIGNEISALLRSAQLRYISLNIPLLDGVPIGLALRIQLQEIVKCCLPLTACVRLNQLVANIGLFPVGIKTVELQLNLMRPARAVMIIPLLLCGDAGLFLCPDEYCTVAADSAASLLA